MSGPTPITVVVPVTQEGWITRLTLAKPCPACAGAGLIACPRWQEWGAEAERTGSLPQPEPNCAEEEPCADCEGIGLLVTDAGRAILRLVSVFGADAGRRP